MSAGSRVITSKDMDACPKRSFAPSHYRDDGTCRCSERPAAEAELHKARAELDRAKARLRAAQEWLQTT